MTCATAQVQSTLDICLRLTTYASLVIATCHPVLLTACVSSGFHLLYSASVPNPGTTLKNRAPDCGASRIDSAHAGSGGLALMYHCGFGHSPSQLSHRRKRSRISSGVGCSAIVRNSEKKIGQRKASGRGPLAQSPMKCCSDIPQPNDHQRGRLTVSGCRRHGRPPLDLEDRVDKPLISVVV